MRRGMNAAAKGAEAGFRNVDSGLDVLLKSLKEVEAAADDVGDELDQSGKQAKGAERDVRQLGTSLRGAGQAFNALGDAVGIVNPRLGNAIGLFGRVRQSAAGVGDAFRRVRGDSEGAAAGVGRFGGGLGRVVAIGAGVVSALGAIAAAMLAIKVASAAASASFNFLRDSVSLAAQAEQTAVSFRVLTGSAEEASKVIKELRELAVKTPLDSRDVIQAGQQLIAFGTATEDVTDLVRRLGDISSGIDTLSLKELADIVGKIQTQGRVFGDDIRQLAGRGIPIISELAKAMNVAEGEVRGLVEQGRVGFPQLLAAIQNMTNEGGKSFNLLEEQSKTFNGLLSNIEDGWVALRTTIGAPIADALKPLLADLVGLIDQLVVKAQELQPAIKSFADEVVATLQVAFSSPEGFFTSIDAARDRFGLVFIALFEQLGDVFQKAIEIAAFNAGEAIRVSFDALFNEVGAAAQEKLRSVVQGTFQTILSRATLGLSDAVAPAAAVARPFNPPATGSAFANGLLGRGDAPDLSVSLDPLKEAFEKQTDATLELNGLVSQQLKENRLASEAGTNPFAEAIGGFGITPSTVTVPPLAEGGDQATIEKAAAAGAAAALTVAAQPQTRRAEIPGENISFLDRAALPGGNTGTIVGGPGRGETDQLAEQLKQMEELRDAGLITSREFSQATDRAATEYTNALGTMQAGQARMAESGKSELDKLMASWGDLSANVDKAAVSASQSVANNLTTALTDLASGTKSASEAFEAMAASIVNDITRIVIQLLIQYAISQALGYAVGGIGGVAGVAVRHDGSHGGTARRRNINPAAFSAAKRYHSGGTVGQVGQTARQGIPGLAANEEPAILQTGEEVLSREDARRFRTRSGSQSEAQTSGQQRENSVTILNVDDPNRIKEIISNDPEVVLNVINRNLPKVKKMLGT